MTPAIWITIGIVLLCIEIFTPSFVAGTLGLGAFAGALANALGFGWNIQIIVVSIVSIILFIFIRPIWLRYLKKTKSRESNADALIGKEGKVTEEIDASKGTGRVAVFGDKFPAKTEDGSTISVGEAVEIVRLESITVIVKKI